MSYKNFEVGEKFPLPIKAAGEGALIQADSNGLMFILQLSHTDVIAVEAFRTGKMEFALYEDEGLLFFLYKIDGIFKQGWGDAPLGLSMLKKEQLPTEKSLLDNTLHLYLVDANLQLLLAVRQVELNDDFMVVLKKNIKSQLQKPVSQVEFVQRVQAKWQQMSAAKMREKASAIQEVALSITAPQK